MQRYRWTKPFGWWRDVAHLLPLEDFQGSNRNHCTPPDHLRHFWISIRPWLTPGTTVVKRSRHLSFLGRIFGAAVQ
ncbi:hypothetical protein KP509_14G088000 [Ceratopteris richardii]|uniref:Uncharacterized protein n=1 Tax=Ceratopteris richardii TaxID=49495 RepID=A0A8T2TA32_CERRI|nr:hypothetical protein KP509_14G088000 [Ceratopteris richardii]